MLVLTRKKNETLNITTPQGETIVITVTQTKTSNVRLGVSAPKEMKILRGELHGGRTITETRDILDVMDAQGGHPCPQCDENMEPDLKRNSQGLVDLALICGSCGHGETLNTQGTQGHRTR